ncbi:MAG: hypothetical protein V2A79_03300, partial [Planctomycetota bacterium]
MRFQIELPQHGLGRAYDVRSATLAKELQVRFADHPPVHHPHAIRPPVLALHGLDDLFDRLGVVAVALKHLVAQRYSIRGHHQPDA